MRRHLIFVLLATAVLALPAWAQEPPVFADGTMSGDATDSRAVIWTRTTAPTPIRLEYGPSASLGAATPELAQTSAASDFTAKVELSGLRPGTRYYYRAATRVDNRQAASLVGSFKTAPPPSAPADVRFAWSADLSERFKPYRIFDSIRAQEVDFFMFLGDTVYADNDANARTLAEYRAIHRRNREDDAFHRFVRSTSIYAIWDDHEVANNFDGTHERLPIGRQAFLEYWPIRPDLSDARRLYRSFRWGKLLEVFLLDTRQYRSPPFDRDTAEKTLLGSAQKAWLKQGLRSSDATFKVIATTVPLKYHGADSWEGYTTERQELFDFITRSQIRSVVFLAGDVHYAAVLRYKEGFVEAIAGPLAQLINRRRPVAGEPETEFASNASFTFGLVRVIPSALTIEIWDVEGRRLHTTTVRP